MGRMLPLIIAVSLQCVLGVVFVSFIGVFTYSCQFCFANKREFILACFGSGKARIPYNPAPAVLFLASTIIVEVILGTMLYTLRKSTEGAPAPPEDPPVAPA